MINLYWLLSRANPDKSILVQIQGVDLHAGEVQLVDVTVLHLEALLISDVLDGGEVMTHPAIVILEDLDLEHLIDLVVLEVTCRDVLLGDLHALDLGVISQRVPPILHEGSEVDEHRLGLVTLGVRHRENEELNHD